MASTCQHLPTNPPLFILGMGSGNFSRPQLPPLSKSAQNVYKLHPQGIKVVMALRDRSTAGKIKYIANDALTTAAVVLMLVRFWNVRPSWWCAEI